MPYIKEADRTPFIDAIEGLTFESPGDLNYAISLLAHQYIFARGLRYSTINEVIGVMECAKLELYRTLAAPYENVKAGENGSVSGLDSEFLQQQNLKPDFTSIPTMDAAHRFMVSNPETSREMLDEITEAKG